LELDKILKTSPYEDWHEDEGAVLWWLIPIAEPPYVGTPNDDDWPYLQDDMLVWSIIPPVWLKNQRPEHLDLSSETQGHLPTEIG
jgi:hypothetical protein